VQAVSDAPKENASTELYERRPVTWWAIVVVCIGVGLSLLVKAGCIAAS
jgi:hypothetical protein